MDTLEVLTLVPVIFAALAYIDNHQDKKQLSSTPIEDSSPSFPPSDPVAAGRNLLFRASILYFHKPEHIYRISRRRIIKMGRCTRVAL